MNAQSPKPWLILLVTAVAVTLASLDLGIVNVALPTIAEQFNRPILSVQWVVSIYLFMMCAILPLCGKIGDTYSRKSVYLLGFLVFTISSLLCGISSSLWQLIFFRGLQGFGAAMIIANNMPLVLINLPEHLHGKALGFVSMIVATGAIAGPGIGGFLLAAFSWRSIFYVNLPLGILALILGYNILPPTVRTTTKIQLDLSGSLLLALTIGAILLLLTNENFFTWHNGLYLLIASIFALLFYFRERSTANPLLHFELFRNATFTSSLIFVFLAITALSCSNILLPFYLYQHQLPITMIGIIMLTAPLLVVIIAPISGHLINNVKQSWLINCGLTLIALALYLQSQLTANTHLGLIFSSQILLGIGFGLFQSPNNYSILKSIPIDHISMGNSIGSLARNLGRVFGTTASTAIFTAIQSYLTLHHRTAANAFISALKISLLIAAILVTLAVIYSFAHKKN